MSKLHLGARALGSDFVGAQVPWNRTMRSYILRTQSVHSIRVAGIPFIKSLKSAGAG